MKYLKGDGSVVRVYQTREPSPVYYIIFRFYVFPRFLYFPVFIFPRFYISPIFYISQVFYISTAFYISPAFHIFPALYSLDFHECPFHEFPFYEFQAYPGLPVYMILRVSTRVSFAGRRKYRRFSPSTKEYSAFDVVPLRILTDRRSSSLRGSNSSP